MGTSISIDKHVSSLDDILEMTPAYFEKIKFESKISPEITQHLKIWRFTEDKKKFESVKSQPVLLSNLQQSGFFFSSEEAYLLLLIYKPGSESIYQPPVIQSIIANCNLALFPHSLWGVVQSAENLTPRGLQNAFSTNDKNDEFLQNHQLDSFLLSKRRGDEEDKLNDDGGKNGNSQFKYMIFVWNGKQAGAMVKAQAISKGYELDSLLSKAKDSVLQVFFAGGVIRGKKLQRSNVLMFDEINDQKTSQGKGFEMIKDNPNTPSAEQIMKAYQTVYLFKWLFPESLIQRHMTKALKSNRSTQRASQGTANPGNYSHFQNSFISARGAAATKRGDKQTQRNQAASSSSYWSRFDDLDRFMDVDSDSDIDYDSDEQERDESMLEDSNKLKNQGGASQAPKLSEMPKQVPNLNLGGVPAKQQPPSMGKLNLKGIGALPKDSYDEEMKNDTVVPQMKTQTGPPQMKMGGGFSLDLSKASKGAEDNRQDPTAEPENKSRMPIPSLKMGAVLEQPEQKPKKVGLGLDLTKAQTIQKETLEKNEQIIQKAKDNATAPQQQAKDNQGASLQINISNLGKVSEVVEAPPLLRRDLPDMKVNQLSQIPQQAKVPTTDEKTNGTGQLVPPEKMSDEDFDMKGTSRKEYENEYYKRICSEIIEDFLYLGSDFIAQDKSMLDQYGITHIINCAADYSANYFDDTIKYKKYHLKDHVREQIECVFYDAIQFIEDARSNKGKVYVHCVQGVSRSATVCLAYLIYKQKMTFNDGLAYLKEKRPVANPNMTFIAQLICFYKRLFEQQFDSVPVSPRVFMIGSHQPEDPEMIVSILIMENLYHGKNSKVLDPRGMFIVQGKEIIRIWVGSQIPQMNLQPYRDYAEKYIKVLQEYERAPIQYAFVNQFEEDSKFWKLFNLEQAPTSKCYEQTNEWNLWFIDLQKARQQEKKAPVVTQMKSYKDEVQEEQYYKPRLYTYPYSKQSSTVFDQEELEQADALMILCVRANEEKDIDEDTVYVWKGTEFEEGHDTKGINDTQKFIDEVIQQYWGAQYQKSKLRIIEEEPGEESDDFLNFFD